MKKIQKGASLVEMMIAVALSLLFILASGAIYISGKNVFRYLDAYAYLQQNGRYVTDYVGRNVRMIGFPGIRSGGVTGSMKAIQIVDGGTAGVPDEIVLSYISEGSDCGGISSRDPSAPIQGVVTNDFYVDTTNSRLMCRDMKGETHVMAESVQNMQILVGSKLLTSNITYQPGDLNSYNNLGNIVSIRMALLLVGNDLHMTPADQNYAKCKFPAEFGFATNPPSTNLPPASDRRICQMYVSTFQVRNGA